MLYVYAICVDIYLYTYSCGQQGIAGHELQFIAYLTNDKNGQNWGKNEKKKKTKNKVKMATINNSCKKCQ